MPILRIAALLGIALAPTCRASEPIAGETVPPRIADREEEMNNGVKAEGKEWVEPSRRRPPPPQELRDEDLAKGLVGFTFDESSLPDRITLSGFGTAGPESEDYLLVHVFIDDREWLLLANGPMGTRKVVASFDMPRLPESVGLYYRCKSNGKPDPWLIARGPEHECRDADVAATGHAWRLDPKAGRITEVSPASITCLDVGCR